MSSSDTPIDNIKFATSVLARLGEELVPHLYQEISELVRNSYDADATECHISLRGVDKVGGEIVVTDTGDGMSVDQIKDGWLTIGASGKHPSQVTRLGRRPVGDKGLGRLAAMRAGQQVELITRPRDNNASGTTYRVVIDWDRFQNVSVVEGVPINIETVASREAHGTTLRLINLRRAFDESELDKLARSIVLLSDPFESTTTFKPRLEAPGFNRLEKLVQEG